MPKYIQIPGFHGGQSVDQYAALNSMTFQKSNDLDVFVNSNSLRPHTLKLQEMTLPTVSGGTDITVKNSYLASNNKYYFIGSATIAAATNIVLWSTSALASAPSYTADYNAAGTPAYVLEEYKDAIYFGNGTALDKWGVLSGSPSRSNVGTVTTGVTLLKNHRGLGLLFFAHNSSQTIGTYNNTTFTATSLSLDKDDTAVGMEEYGRFLVIGVRGAGSKKSRFLIWDGSATTVDDIIEINDDALLGFKIVNGVITYISQTNISASLNYVRLSTVVPGGKPVVIKEQKVGTGSLDTSIVNNFSSFGDIFFYGLNNATDTLIDLGIFAYGSTSSLVPKLHTLWRTVSTGVTTNVSISSIKHNGSSIIVTWGTTTGGGGTQHIDTITGSGLTLTSPSTGVYESKIFPLNSGLKGKIKKITLTHVALPASCGFTVQIKHFGNYPFGSTVPSVEAYQTLYGPQGNASVSGMTQSTTSSTYTEIQSPIFKDATHAQIKILFDEVSGTDTATIVFPILIELE